MLSKHLSIMQKIEFNRVYFLRFYTKYDTQVSKYLIKLIVAMSSTNATKLGHHSHIEIVVCRCFRFGQG